MNDRKHAIGTFAIATSFVAAMRAALTSRFAAAANDDDENAPSHLRCAITGEVFRDPVVLIESGHTYERAAIARWLASKFPMTDPTTNVEVVHGEYVPNWALRASVDEWARANGRATLEPPETVSRCTKDGKAIARNWSSGAGALTRQYVEALHRSHPRHAAALIFLLTFTVATATAMTFTVMHTMVQVIRFAMTSRAVRFVMGDERIATVQSLAWWGGVGAFLWLANTPEAAAARRDGARLGQGDDIVGRNFMRRAGAR